MLRAGTAPTDLHGPLSGSFAEPHVAHNYAPFPVELVRAEGAWLEDAEGRQYLDMFAGYSALNFGHRHPSIIAAAHAQLDRLTLTSRSFGNDQLEPFCRELAALCGKDAVLPMNTGAEAVETAIKTARRWGYDVKGVPAERATIVVFAGNFHGRTTTIVGFSSDGSTRRGFGPFTPGFRIVPYGDLDAVRRAIDETTVAVLVEPIQGEAGVIVPPPGFLSGLRRLCHETRVLLVADEIQSGFCRTGHTFACDADGVVPDLYLLGKALGGGVVALSAVVGDWDVLAPLGPGSHGSTFGGNPLACAIGRAVLALVRTGEYQERAAELGEHMLRRLRELPADHVAAVRGRGLWAGVDLAPSLPPAHRVCELLLARGVLMKDTHEVTLRVAPPLVIERAELDWAVDRLGDALEVAASEGFPLVRRPHREDIAQ
jgi:ornithine--oxo-acid transaminase